MTQTMRVAQVDAQQPGPWLFSRTSRGIRHTRAPDPFFHFSPSIVYLHLPFDQLYYFSICFNLLLFVHMISQHVIASAAQ